MKIRRSRRRWLIALSVLVAVVGVASLSAVMWYRQMLMPADISNKAAVRIDIKEGMNSGDIADSLEQKKLIRSSLAFSAYVRLHNASKYLLYKEFCCFPIPKNHTLGGQNIVYEEHFWHNPLPLP